VGSREAARGSSGARPAWRSGERPGRDARHGHAVPAANRQLRARLPVLAAHEAQRGRRAGAERARTAELQGYTEELMMTLARMLPREYRGFYAKSMDD